MAVVPLSGTNIIMYSGIPFNNDYKHTRWFDTLADQQNWFAQQTQVYNKSDHNFQRIAGESFIATDKNIDELWNVNYLQFTNENYNKTFYAFVTKLEYVNTRRTDVYFEIDVLQTWRFNFNFKPSYVVREHCQLWNTDGTPVINTVDEGLNYGTEYDTVYVNNLQPNNGYKWLMIIAKNPMHSGASTDVTPTVLGSPVPLTVYAVPFKNNNTVPLIHINNPSPFGVGDAQISKPSDVLKALYKSTTAVDNIVSLYVTDSIPIDVTVTTGAPDTITFPDGSQVQAVTVTDGTTDFKCMYFNYVESFSSQDYYVGGKYDNYKTVTESKLLMYPYTQLTLDDFKGNRVSLKNEYINNNNLYLTVKSSLGLSNKVSYGIQDYNSASTTSKLQVSDEHALINNEPNDIPIITSLLSAYIQGNKNSLNIQKTSIEWNGMFGAIGNVMTANPLGVEAGLGNAYLEIQKLNAKQADISNRPPNITKQGSNSSYSIGNNYNGVFLIKKQIKDEYIKKLTDFFNMFGYKKNEVKYPNFHTRQNWNYVQTAGCVITASINNEDLQELKDVFDKGITLWHTDDIGNYTLTNNVI